MGFPGGSVVKNAAASAREIYSIPWLGTPAGGGNGNPLQYSCLGNPMDRGAWRATVMGSQRAVQHWVTEHTHTHTHTPVVYICQKLKSKRFSKLVKQLPVSLFPYALVTAILLLLLSLASWPGSPTQCAVHASCYRLWWSKRRGKVAQSCPALYDPMDCSPPGSSVHGISQASIPDWVAITPGDLPDPGIKPSSLALQADSLPPEPVK